jgi:hypothetical protein
MPKQEKNVNNNSKIIVKEDKSSLLDSDVVLLEEVSRNSDFSAIRSSDGHV